MGPTLEEGCRGHVSSSRESSQWAGLVSRASDKRSHTVLSGHCTWLPALAVWEFLIILPLSLCFVR